MERKRKTLEEKLNNYIVDKNNCWVWQSSINKDGYGQFSHKGLSTTAHRAYYIHYIDPSFQGSPLQLDHLCRNRRCINPEHLEPVTRKVNTQRGFSHSAIAARTNKCKRGHDLIPENVYVQEHHKKGKLRHCRLCRKEREEKYLIDAICHYCGNTFKVNKYRANVGKFCSMKCSSLNRWKSKAS